MLQAKGCKRKVDGLITSLILNKGPPKHVSAGTGALELWQNSDQLILGEV